MTPCICNAQYVPYLYACIILHYNICNHMHMHIGATLHTCIGSHVIQTRELYIFLTLSFSCIPENILSCVCVCLHVHGGVSNPRGKRSGFWNHGGVFPDHQLDFNCPMFFTCTICMWDSDSPSKSKWSKSWETIHLFHNLYIRRYHWFPCQVYFL